jgi:L-malate glycosyltransferase
MKIAYLAAASAIHTVRWVNALAQRGWTIFLITMHEGEEPLHEKVQLFKLPISAPFGYFSNVPFLKKLLKQLQPDLLHVHYATGYGTLGRLCGFQPVMLSVWGSDIFEFPKKSRWHRLWLVKNLQSATQIASTSQIMATATRKLCNDFLEQKRQLFPNFPIKKGGMSSFRKPIAITPFGIDTRLFCPHSKLRDNKVFKIGTVKTLAPKYGIDTLIHAFYQLRNTLAKRQSPLAQQLRLGIAGDGPQLAELQALVTQLGLNEVTEFVGYLPYAQVPAYLNQLDIYVAASRLDSESFGVAILEAAACGLPVVVSRVGGLPEVVEDGIMGLIVEKDNAEQFATALLTLVENPALCQQMGKSGRQHIIENYEWQDSVRILETIYQSMIQS